MYLPQEAKETSPFAEGTVEFAFRRELLTLKRYSQFHDFLRNVLEDFCYRLVFADGNAAQIAPGWIGYF